MPKLEPGRVLELGARRSFHVPRVYKVLCANATLQTRALSIPTNGSNQGLNQWSQPMTALVTALIPPLSLGNPGDAALLTLL